MNPIKKSKPLSLHLLSIILVVLSLLLSTASLVAGATPAEAYSAFIAKDWSMAAKAYAELAEANPESGPAWYRLGQCNLELGKNEEALEALDRARTLGFNEQAVLFSTSRVQAALGNKEKAKELLGKVAELGASRQIANNLSSAPEFAAWLEEGKLDSVLTALTPCSGPAYRHFDFWLGDWNVETPNGQKVGENLVTSDLGGCLLIENWTSVSGQEGKSFNYYDSSDDTWNQIYLDNTGNVSQWPPLKGRLEDGVMVLESAADAKPRSRWRWQDLGDSKVRQSAETSSDGGETWTTVWDSTYVLK